MRTYNKRKLISKKRSRRGGAAADWAMWAPVLIGAAGVGHQIYSTNKEAERAAKLEERRFAQERQDRLDDLAREKELREEERRERQKSRYRDDDEYDEPPRRPAKKPQKQPKYEEPPRRPAKTPQKPKFKDEYDEFSRYPSQSQFGEDSTSRLTNLNPKVYRGRLVPTSLSETEAKTYQKELINTYKNGLQRNDRMPQEYHEYIRGLSSEEKSQYGLL